MSLDAEEGRQDPIIIRRGGEEEGEGHHGGVWKIAYADFMTAMMCFFLVMWLINAANEQTRSALASYFNPVKLTDRNTDRRGLDDVGKGPQSVNTDKETKKISDKAAGRRDEMSGPADNQHSADLAEEQKHSDQNLFSDPYSVLAEIAAETGTKQNVSDKGDGGQQIAGPSSGASGGESYRDPFAPDFWSQQVAVPRQGVQGDPEEARENPAGTEIESSDTGEHPPADARGPEIAAAEASGVGGETPPDQAMYEPVPEVEPLAERPDETRESAAGQAAAGDRAEPDAESAAADRGMEDAQHRVVAAEIEAELARAFEGDRMEEAVSVTSGDKGVLISVTDGMDHGMFAVGSAVPNRELVLAMEKIGRTLTERAGDIKVHGHTDGRPFKSETYDNWRLSSARAHAAYYMLVRGGLDERRIGEVAGFADRELKVADDPYADANRRIEILLELPE